MPASPATIHRDIGLFRLHYIETGQVPTTRGTLRDGVDIGSRVARYWRMFEQGRMAYGAVQALEALPGWRWSNAMSSREVQFAGDVAWLHEYTLRHHGRVFLTRHAPDPRFAKRLSAYRRDFADGNLSTTAARALQRALGPATAARYQLERAPRALPTNRSAPRQRFFEETMTAVRAYVTTHGTADIPRDFVTEQGVPLGADFLRLKRLYSTGRLLAEERRLAENIPDWERLTARAERHSQLRELNAFVLEHGHADVPSWHPLAVLVAELRREEANGTISADLKTKLYALPGWTWYPPARVVPAPPMRLETAAVAPSPARVQPAMNLVPSLAVAQEA
jgi:hypothetical protein